MENSVLRIRGLEKDFGHFKLGPLEMNVPTGAIYGLVGPNGAGKTTTIDLIMGMGAADAGAIEVFGMDHLRDECAVKQRIGYVSPDLIFNAWGKVKRLIGFVRSFYPAWDDAYCTDLLERLDIGWNDKIGTLSFGARTKLGLVIALSHRPALLLLDEPLVGLDAVSKQEVFTELLDAVKDENRTVLISSHNLTDLERFADHIGLIDHGNLLLEGPTSEIINRFRVADCISADGALSQTPGLRIQSREGERCRVLVDLTQCPLESLSGSGVQVLSASPLTLEELCVALAKKNARA
jgi:ABC-2 type transport system ATP-binding protein